VTFRASSWREIHWVSVIELVILHSKNVANESHEKWTGHENSANHESPGDMIDDFV